ncbi:chorion peroxidase-like isoform X2 [Topomyia yanbarensis]|uniref:chorion peroxidase-like isoform X2 n=1 Tax=Topomyia yanbarensis TaxID=2498891 RepID=UPI00273A9E6B|nr:chorion peroxidase-like isoform X2 [Topomyia yanbarensis]
MLAALHAAINIKPVQCDFPFKRNSCFRGQKLRINFNSALRFGDFFFSNATLCKQDRPCPANSTCVHPLRCTRAIRDWADLPHETDPSVTPVFDRTYQQRCRFSTKFEGICCQTGAIADSAEVLADCHRRRPQRATAMAGGETAEFERLPPSENSDATTGCGRKVHRRAFADYDQLYGINTTNQPHSRTKRCIIGPRCKDEHMRYRRFDGRCNNIQPGRSLWGSAGYPMERVLAPAYGDRVGSPRKMSTAGGNVLPSARRISALLFDDVHVPDKRYNVLMMQFGQFLVHDITKSQPAAKDVACCVHSGIESHPDCLPIAVASNDPFYSQFGVKCMEFVRTAVVPKSRCQAGHARQISAVTHFIDGSGIYGSSAAEANSLRAHEGGRLKSLMHRQSPNELPPLETKAGACRRDADMCFKVGDERVNQIVTLVAVQTLFLREHNRIARALQNINPHWNDEMIFQEARRIVAAEIQHIVYSEYLPKVVGPGFIDQFDLFASEGHSNFYNPKINPSITSEFSAAAFRFGHSTVPGQLKLPQGFVDTHKTFFNPSPLRNPPFYDGLFQGMLQQPMQKMDDKFAHSLTWFLNSKEQQPFGSDLASINIQRGRDHALQPYNHYLRLSGRRMKKDFKDFGPLAGPKLQQLYSTPNDVDLYVGGILESPVQGGIVGKTFAEIISDQFSRLKRGDRYFYSNGLRSNPGHFTKLQLEQLQRVTLAGILCANANDPSSFKVLPDAFAVPHGTSNPLVSCRSDKIPKLNLKLWKD